MYKTLAEVYDPKANALNLMRLLMASGVIVWHSFALTGHTIGWVPLYQLMTSVWVDGFFAMSGFLLAGSWLARPQLRAFLRARALRLLPAYYACLLVIALLWVPLVTRLAGEPPVSLGDSLQYIQANAFVWTVQHDIGGSPVNVPYPGAWNGSLWTLGWEALCYLSLATLGALGLLRRGRVAVVIFLAALCGALALVVLEVPGEALLAPAFRFAQMFVAGMLLQLYAARVPVNRAVIAVVVALLVGSMWLPDYRLVGALPAAYLLVVAGASIRSPILRLKNDLSYGAYIYAFPWQQTLAMFGAWKLGVAAFAALSLLGVVPFAAASWFGLERYALRLKPKSDPSPHPEGQSILSKEPG